MSYYESPDGLSREACSRIPYPGHGRRLGPSNAYKLFPQPVTVSTHWHHSRRDRVFIAVYEHTFQRESCDVTGRLRIRVYGLGAGKEPNRCAPHTPRKYSASAQPITRILSCISETPFCMLYSEFILTYAYFKSKGEHAYGEMVEGNLVSLFQG